MSFDTAIQGVKLQLRQGDITEQADIDAVVNAANAELRIGGGVAGAIHRAAGPELEEVCRPLAPIQPGEAVITEAFNLPNRHVIHCLGPIYGRDEPSDELLANAYRNSLRRAEEYRLGSVAFPAISTGAFGYPVEDAAGVTIDTIRQEAGGLQHVNLIRMVLFGEKDYRVYEQALQRVAS